MGIFFFPATLSECMPLCNHQEKSKCFAYLSQKNPKPKMAAARGYLQPGDAAPDFKATVAVRQGNDIAMKEVKLSDYKDKYLVLFSTLKTLLLSAPPKSLPLATGLKNSKKLVVRLLGPQQTLPIAIGPG